MKRVQRSRIESDYRERERERERDHQLSEAEAKRMLRVFVATYNETFSQAKYGHLVLLPNDLGN